MKKSTMDSWEALIIQWINCLHDKTNDYIRNIKELEDGSIYHKLINRLKSWNSKEYSDCHRDIVLQFLKNEYPNFTCSDTSDQIDNLCIALLILSRVSLEPIFHKSLCANLNYDLQIKIKSILETIYALGKSVTLDDLCKTFALSDKTDLKLLSTKSKHILEDFLNSPAVRTVQSEKKMYEQSKHIRHLRADIETLRYEKSELIEDIKIQKKHIDELQNKLQTTLSELKVLRANNVDYVDDNLQEKEDIKLLQLNYKKELHSLETYVAELQNENCELQDERNDLNSKVKLCKAKCRTLEEKNLNNEQIIESMLIQIEKKEEELVELKIRHEELRNYLKEKSMQLNNQSFEVDDRMVSDATFNKSEALSSVIEIQLLDTKKDLVVMQNKFQNMNSILTVVIEEYVTLKRKYDNLFNLNTEIKSEYDKCVLKENQDQKILRDNDNFVFSEEQRVFENQCIVSKLPTNKDFIPTEIKLSFADIFKDNFYERNRPFLFMNFLNQSVSLKDAKRLKNNISFVPSKNKNMDLLKPKHSLYKPNNLSKNVEDLSKINRLQVYKGNNKNINYIDSNSVIINIFKLLYQEKWNSQLSSFVGMFCNLIKAEINTKADENSKLYKIFNERLHLQEQVDFHIHGESVFKSTKIICSEDNEPSGNKSNQMCSRDTQTESKRNQMSCSRDIQTDSKSNPIMSSKDTQTESKSNQMSCSKDTQTESKSNQMSCSKDTQTESKSNQMSCSKDTQTESKSNQMSCSKDTQTENKGNQMSCSRDTQTDCKSNPIMSSKDSQTESKSNQMTYSKDTQTDIKSDPLMSSMDTQTENKSNQMTCSKDTQTNITSNLIITSKDTQTDTECSELLTFYKSNIQHLQLIWLSIYESIFNNLKIHKVLLFLNKSWMLNLESTLDIINKAEVQSEYKELLSKKYIIEEELIHVHYKNIQTLAFNFITSVEFVTLLSNTSDCIPSDYKHLDWLTSQLSNFNLENIKQLKLQYHTYISNKIINIKRRIENFQCLLNCIKEKCMKTSVKLEILEDKKYNNDIDISQSRQFQNYVKEIHEKYELKLEKMKEKMKLVYNNQITAMKKEQETLAMNKLESLQSKFENQCYNHTEELKKYKKHISELTTQLWDVGEKLIIEKQKKEEAIQKFKELKSKMNENIESQHTKPSKPQQENFEDSIANSEKTANALQSIENTSFHKIQSVRGFQIMGNAFRTEDEEGEVFDTTYLTDVQRPRDSLSTIDLDRLSILQMRNSKCKPHLKSSYPGELQIHPIPFSEEEIKTGSTSEEVFNDSLSQSLLTGKKVKRSNRTRTGTETPRRSRRFSNIFRKPRLSMDRK